MPSGDAKRPEHARSIPSPHAFGNREAAGPERAELLRERIERLWPRRKSGIEVAGVLPISDCGSSSRAPCREGAGAGGEGIERLWPRRKSCIEVAGVLPISDCGSSSRASCRQEPGAVVRSIGNKQY